MTNFTLGIINRSSYDATLDGYLSALNGDAVTTIDVKCIALEPTLEAIYATSSTLNQDVFVVILDKDTCIILNENTNIKDALSSLSQKKP